MMASGSAREPIGIGAQYTVYDAGRGRVVKVPNSLDQAISVFLQWVPDREQAQRDAAQVLGFRDKGVPCVLRLAARYPELSAALANPLAASGGSFTQDKVRVLKDVIEASTHDEIPACFEKYVDCILTCWRYGLHD